MGNNVYNNDFKNAAVQKLLSPNSLGISGTARSLGLSPSTLFGWKEKYANRSVMKKANIKTQGIDWTAEEKLEAITKTYSMSEQELGEYLRSNGLHSGDLEAFKHELVSGVPSRGRPKLDPELVQLREENKALKKDLYKKDKALAEVSARVILLKKSRLLWGEPEDEE
jgi:transposase